MEGSVVFTDLKTENPTTSLTGVDQCPTPEVLFWFGFPDSPDF